jgi:Bacterial PH domain
LNKDEEITEHFQGTYFRNNQGMGKIAATRTVTGMIVFTNKRFLFLQKAVGWGAKGFNLIMFCSWGDVVSVSTSGGNRLNLNAKNKDEIEMSVIVCKNTQDVARKIIENKNNFVEKTVIEAKTVIIEEANKDNAMKILQKRLARGEITLDEFNKLITRT